IDRRTEHGPHVTVDVPRVAAAHSGVILQGAHQTPDVLRTERIQRPGADQPEGVQAQPLLDDDLTGRVDAVRPEPLLRVALESDTSCARVDVAAARHVRCDLGQPLFGHTLLPVRKAFGLLRAVGADVAGAVAQAGAVAVGLDLASLAVLAGLRPIPAVLDVAGHQAASPSWESTQARTSFGSKRRCRPTRKPRGPVRLRRHW